MVSFLGLPQTIDKDSLRALEDGADLDPVFRRLLPEVLRTTFAILTAYNPRSMLLPRRVNEQRHYVMRDLLVSAAARGVTVFLTSHILPVVERIAHQFVMIRKGKIVWISSAAELPGSLEELYLELAEPPVSEQLEWLASGQS